MINKEQEEYRTIQFEETELRLGLPCQDHHHAGDHDSNQTVVVQSTTKRGFSETENSCATVDLMLNLSTTVDAPPEHGGDRVIMAKGGGGGGDVSSSPAGSDHAKPPAKAQVVGWPPVRSFRKNIATVQKKTAEEQADQKAANGGGTTGSGAFVKVSMDGAPYLRKVDLKLYKSYQELCNALAKMFCSFTIGDCGTHGTKDFTIQSKLIDLLNGSDYAATYEDKDRDWMLVGDVPWEMFVGSCRRLRIMKGSEAIGLAPRAVEKCKSTT